MPINKKQLALVSVAQVVGAPSHNWKVAGSIPGQGTYLGFRLNPGLGAYDPQSGCVQSPVWVHIGGNQSMFLSLPSCLSKSNGKMSLGERTPTPSFIEI